MHTYICTFFHSHKLTQYSVETIATPQLFAIPVHGGEQIIHYYVKQTKTNNTTIDTC